MSNGIKVFIDANVFVTSWTTDVLLTLAEQDLIRPRWSNVVMDEAAEAIRSVKGGNPSRYLNAIRNAFPCAEVVVEDTDLDVVSLPDPNDRHVVAGALEADCDIIVTYNLKDFPTGILSPLVIRAMHPDDLLMQVASVNPEGTYAAVLALVANKAHPPRSMAEEIEGLKIDRLPRFVSFLEEHAETRN